MSASTASSSSGVPVARGTGASVVQVSPRHGWLSDLRLPSSDPSSGAVSCCFGVPCLRGNQCRFSPGRFWFYTMSDLFFFSLERCRNRTGGSFFAHRFESLSSWQAAPGALCLLFLRVMLQMFLPLSPWLSGSGLDT